MHGGPAALDAGSLHGAGGGRHWPFLDLVRAGAAMLVMLGHARGQFFPEFGALAGAGPLTKAFYLLTGLQHEGVVLFFLVSGFLVGGTAWEAFAAGRFELLRYLSNRFVRIYLVLVPGLLLTLAIYGIGMRYLADARSFAALPAQPWSWPMAVCHLACLQGISCSVLVANAPLWSLSYEWLLYLAAPLVLGLIHAPLPAHLKGPALALLGATLVTLLPAHLQWEWVLFWAAGAVASRAALSRPAGFGPGLAGLALTAGALVVSRLHLLPPLATDLAIMAGFGLALASRGVLDLAPAPRLTAFLADCSYSLYVIHLPVIFLAVAVLQRFAGPAAPGTGLVPALGFAATVTVALLAAALFAHLTERHTRRVQRAVIAACRPAQG